MSYQEAIDVLKKSKEKFEFKPEVRKLELTLNLIFIIVTPLLCTLIFFFFFVHCRHGEMKSFKYKAVLKHWVLALA